jgi:hypothetical protein
MKSVGYLNCVWCPAARSFGIQPLAVADNHCHFGTLLQPSTEHFRGPCGQHVYDLMILEIDQNRSEALSLLPGPVIHTNYSNIPAFVHSILHSAEHGMAADRHTKPTQQPLAWPTSQ